MEDNIFDKIHDVDLQKTMETSYINYATVSYTHLPMNYSSRYTASPY